MSAVSQYLLSHIMRECTKTSYSRSFMISATRLSASMMALRETPLMTDSFVRTLMALEEGWNIFKRGPAAHRAGFHTPPLVSLQSVDQFYNLSDISPCMQISLWENHCPQQNIGQSQYSNRTWKWPGTVFCRQEIGSLNNRRLCRFYSKSLIHWYVGI